MTRLEKSSRISGVSPTACKLESVLLSLKESGKGKGSVKRRVLDGSALNQERDANPLARDVFKGAPENVK